MTHIEALQKDSGKGLRRRKGLAEQEHARLKDTVVSFVLRLRYKERITPYFTLRRQVSRSVWRVYSLYNR